MVERGEAAGHDPASDESSDRRRSPGERRQYTRRTPTVTPPYFEVFERIAVALEQVAQAVQQRQVVLPSDPPRPRSSRNG